MSTRKILFIDRDGTLLVEPADERIDAFEKFELVAGVVPALRRCIAYGYELVMVTNQDGLGTPGFLQDAFDGPQELLLKILRSQGIEFHSVRIDPSFAHENSTTRKPGVALVHDYLADDGWSRAASAVIGDRETDLQFAANLGVRGFRVDAQQGWSAIAHALCDAPRTASIERVTGETHIRVALDLDRVCDAHVATGIGFFDHMLQQLGKHGGFALKLECVGDLSVDEHHTVEDCALVLGEALRVALGDKRGTGRYGFTLPMDEALASAALDLSGRSGFFFDGAFPRERVGDFPSEMLSHFFRSLCDAAGLNLHLSVRGENAHHMIEACFKAVARAMRQAIRRDGDALPSTKGVL